MRSGFRHGLLAAIAALCCAGPAAAVELCASWSEGETAGVLDSALVPEASGLAVSTEVPGRLYHVNDSGNGPFLFTSDFPGADLQKLRLGGVPAVEDPEALTRGELDSLSTIFVGDIGDNLLRRPTVQIFAVRERDIRDGLAPVSVSLSVRYPDGPHNAEAMVMAPGGDLYIFTKSWSNSRQDPAPAGVYRLPAHAWTQPAAEPATLEYLGALDLPALATREKALFSDVVTDAAMAADGSRFLLLTYGYAWEFALDLSSGAIPPAGELQRGRDYQLIRLEPLLGKESIAYLPGDRSFLFGKEFKPDSRPSVLIRMDCLD